MSEEEIKTEAVVEEEVSEQVPERPESSDVVDPAEDKVCDSCQ